MEGIRDSTSVVGHLARQGQRGERRKRKGNSELDAGNLESREYPLPLEAEQLDGGEIESKPSACNKKAYFIVCSREAHLIGDVCAHSASSLF